MPLEFLPLGSDQTIQLDFETIPPTAIVENVRYAILRVRMITFSGETINSIQPDDVRMRETVRGLTNLQLCRNVLCFNFDNGNDPLCLFGIEGVKWLMLCYGMFPLEGWTTVTAELVEKTGMEAGFCPICLDADDGPWSVTRCSHCFHSRCIRSWLSRGKTTCPMCRGKL